MSRARGSKLALLAALALLAGLWIAPVSMRSSWGWDEASHAELPAVRTLLALRAGAIREGADVLLDCQQYPPAFPILLAAVQAFSGPSELAARRTARAVWVAGIFGLWLLGAELARQLGGRGPSETFAGTSPAGTSAPGGVPSISAYSRAAWIAALLGVLSPLALSYSGSLFLEVPSAVVSIYALRAWIRRRSAGAGLAREFAAGAWIALALFTKWNYGLLLGLGLFLDWLIELVLALRGSSFGAYARRSLALASLPVLGCAWWFVWPLPGGLELGAAHRAAVLGFLEGNRDASMDTPYAQRLLHWATSFAYSPRVLLLELVGLLLALGELRRPAVRALGLVLLAEAVPITAHNFHLDRFLVCCGPPLWCLAALGLTRVLPRKALAAAAVGLAAIAAATIRPALDSEGLLRWLGLANADPAVRAHQALTLADWRSLAGDRPLPTAGLPRVEHDQLLDLLAAAAVPDARVAWIGVNPELSPAAIQLGLLARGWSDERFRSSAGRVRPEDGKPEMLITHEFQDPGWESERLRAWAGRFDLIFTTRPMDWKGREREPLARYREELLASGAWIHERLGSVAISRPTREPIAIEVYACRPRPR